MRHKAWAQSYLESCPQLSFDPSDYKGRWKDHFGYKQIALEIGSGKGDYLRGMARLYPDVFWIGIERDLNVSAVAQKKIQEDLPKNLFWIVSNASQLESYFEEGELDLVYLNFSDPWPKKAHTKRRLTSDAFIENILKLSNESLEIKLKTDNKSLFEYTHLLWEAYPVKLIEFSVDYRRDAHPEDVFTEYEQKFVSENKAIYRSVWRKKSC